MKTEHEDDKDIHIILAGTVLHGAPCQPCDVSVLSTLPRRTATTRIDIASLRSERERRQRGVEVIITRPPLPPAMTAHGGRADAIAQKTPDGRASHEPNNQLLLMVMITSA